MNRTKDPVFIAMAAEWSNNPARREYRLGPVPGSFTWADGAEATLEDLNAMAAAIRAEEKNLMSQARRMFGEMYSPSYTESSVAAVFAHAEAETWNSIGEFESLEESDPDFWDRLASSYQTLVRLVATVNAGQAVTV